MKLAFMFWSKKEKFTDRAIAYLKAANLNDGKPAISLPHAATPVVKSYSADLCICYVVDSGNQFEYIQNCHVEKDGIDDDELHRIGLANLRKWAGSHNTRVQPYGRIFAVLMGGNFEASLILLDDFWDHSFKQFVKGDYAAAIPARDILSFCDSSSPEAIGELQQLIARITPKGDHLVSDKVYFRREGKFEPHLTTSSL